VLGNYWQSWERAPDIRDPRNKGLRACFGNALMGSLSRSKGARSAPRCGEVSKKYASSLHTSSQDRGSSAIAVKRFDGPGLPVQGKPGDDLLTPPRALRRHRSPSLILLAKSSNQRTEAAEGRDGDRISRRFRLVSDFASSITLDAPRLADRAGPAGPNETLFDTLGVRQFGNAVFPIQLPVTHLLPAPRVSKSPDHTARCLPGSGSDSP